MLPLLLLMAGTSHADDVLPSYREEVVIAAWKQLDGEITDACDWPRGSRGVGAPLECRADALKAVVAHANRFLERVADDARIHFLVGLAYRHAGDLHAAERAQEDAVARNRDRADAWWELGELRELRGDWAGAHAAFTEVVRLVPTGPRALPGWFQLAQTDAHLGDAEAFERDLREALRFGFSFRDVAGQPAWKAFFADPRLHDTLDRMLVVYADEDVRASLASP
jgi:tetratricopeptide (TPR) repeat protein